MRPCRLEDPTAVLRQRPRAGDPRTRLPAALAAHGTRTALVGSSVPGGAITYADLAPPRRGRPGPARRRASAGAGAGERSLDTVVAYLGALAGGHPVLLAGTRPGRSADASATTSTSSRAGGRRLLERRTGTAHDLHPDLALLLTTSGTTGVAQAGPPLLRRTCSANATAIAESLALRPDDLARDDAAAALLLRALGAAQPPAASAPVCSSPTGRWSTPCFWDEFARAGATSLRRRPPHLRPAGPRSASPTRDLPRLRYVTQAGGRLAARRRTPLGRAGSAARLRLLRHVRADRGDRPDGRTCPPDLAARGARRRSAMPIPGGRSTSSRSRTPTASRRTSASSSTPDPT